MNIFKCKMCGGTIEYEEGSTVGVCDSCGTRQTLPKTNDDVITNLFNRANNLRLKAEFDKAEEIYERIVQEDDSEAEAHWGLVLCRYGIEYVEDPATHERIPTCHRTLYEPVTKDVDYLAAIDYSDAIQQSIYEKEARAIDRIQKGILEIVKNEKPFDVFICYKETDENGKRTIDSTIANDIYYQLTQEGFKVFYAAITLEDKLGQEYEPYIFAALNSAKVMLVLGTKPEYFNAVWVKNEWSRFIKLMKNDRSRLLIPCYRDMDAYDLPEEFAHLQAQDIRKIGFINDVIRNINRVCRKDTPQIANENAAKSTAVSTGATGISPLLQRAFLFLEDEEWNRADEYCEQILNRDPENALAYLCKLMAELQIRTRMELPYVKRAFEDNTNYQRAVRFADPELRRELKEYSEQYNARVEHDRMQKIYEEAKEKMEAATTENEFIVAADLFMTIENFEDAARLALACREEAEITRKNRIYDHALSQMSSNVREVVRKAQEEFQSISGWKDSDEKVDDCYRWLEELARREEEERKEEERQEAEAAAKAAARKKRNRIIAICTTCFLLISAAVGYYYWSEILPRQKYAEACALADAGEYSQAETILADLDTTDAMKVDMRTKASEYLDEEAYDQAYFFLEQLGDIITVANSKYERAIELADDSAFHEARLLLESIPEGTTVKSDKYPEGSEKYISCEDLLKTCKYADAKDLFEKGDLAEALTAFEELGEHEEAVSYVGKCLVSMAEKAFVVSNNTLNNDGKKYIPYLAERLQNKELSAYITKNQEKSNYALGVYYHQLGNKEKAIEFLEKCTSGSAVRLYETIAYPLDLSKDKIDSLLSNYKGVWQGGNNGNQYADFYHECVEISQKYSATSYWVFTFRCFGGSSLVDDYKVESVKQTNKTTYEVTTSGRNNYVFIISNEKNNDNRFKMRRISESNFFEYVYMAKTFDEAFRKFTLSSGWYVITAQPNLRIRSDPGTSSKILGKVNKGELVFVEEIRYSGNSPWGYIYYDNTWGWICLDYADPA